MERKFKIYLGQSVTNAPDTFLIEMDQLRVELCKAYDVLHFVSALPQKEQETIDNLYEYDLLQLESSDLFIAVADYPSIGLGMELEHARNENVPTLIFINMNRQTGRIVPAHVETRTKMKHKVELIRQANFAQIPIAIDRWVGKNLATIPD